MGVKEEPLYPEEAAYFGYEQQQQMDSVPWSGQQVLGVPRENGKASDGFAQFDSFEEAQRAMDSGLSAPD